MAQHDMNIANAGFPAVRSDINSALSAIQTNHSGTSRPTGAVAGQIWLDTTNATNPTLKFFDGTDDISLATIDYSANTVNWLDSTVSVTGLATTATGTVLTLSDSATTQTVNFIIDNEKEIRFSEADGNGSNYVALKAPASLASDVTFTLPSADGTADQILKTDGSGNLSFADASGGGIQWQSVQTTGFTAVAGNGYPCNTTSAGFTVTLPATPSAGDQLQLVDYAGTFDTNPLTIDPNGEDILGQASNVTVSKDREAITLTYIDSTQGWLPSSGYQESTAGLAIPYSIDFLVVAGGGGGGSGENGGGDGGGGGGAGGFRTSTQTVSSGTTITVTVGDGGAGITSGSQTDTQGSDGSDSSISGTSLTTITSTGGGGGGSDNTAGSANHAGRNGGSGGGAAHCGISSHSGGSGNTPSTNPSQGNNGGSTTGGSGNGAGAGGGGASAVGGSVGDLVKNGGAGGAGSASSITGSSVTYAGGGGGGSDGNEGTGGTGGSGGGANGATQSTVAGTATVNLGGGGGGAASMQGGGFASNGAKGVVILSMPTVNYTGTTTGSPTVTTSGSNTILKFTGSGSYTA